MVIKDISTVHKNNQEAPIKMNIDLNTLTVFCKYVLQSHTFVKMEHLVNLRKLIGILDISTYENDPEKMKRINFIIKGLEARLDNNINDQQVILSYINGGITYEVDFLDYNNLYLNRHDIEHVHKLVSETLQYKFIYTNIPRMEELCTRFKTSNYSARGSIVQEFEMLADDMKNEFRKTKTENSITEMSFSLKKGKFENCVTNVYNIVTSPSRRLLCGMQGLNEMTGGGFESGRVYMLFGTSGVGKSITLLNLIYQIKKCNINYKTKDPTKTPCIVLLTMENTVVETITRLFDLVVENSRGMQNYSLEDVLDKLRNDGQLYIGDGSPIDIVVKYKPNKSINTSWLYTLCDDLEDEGYEVIGLVQDHVKRIRSIYPSSDIRLELGEVVNEFKVFAAEKDIPVITNSHLNRDGARVLEDAARKQNQDVGKLLGKSNVGESLLMVDNLDVATIIALDYDNEGNKYMTFNLIKMRDKTNRTYIAQPFYPGSEIRLVEDLGGIPQFKESIHTNPQMNGSSIIKISGASSMTNNITDVINDFIDNQEKENAFDNKKFYNLEDASANRPVIECPVLFTDLTKSTDSFNDIMSKFTHMNQVEVPIEFAS